MSIAAVAIIGRLGQPIYLRDFDAPLLFDLYTQPSSLGQPDDFFGDVLLEETAKQHAEWPCRMKYQFALFASYERMGQMLEGGWKGGAGLDACWMGLICTVDGFNAYGYATTNAKYIILVEDAIAPDDISIQKTRENELKILLSKVHGLYTDYLLNPFSQPNTKISSSRFESRVHSLANSFNTR